MRHALGYTSMLYQVPPFVIGYSIYNHTHAIQYVKVKLRQGGFKVTTNGYMLYIDWSMRTKHKKERKHDSNEEPKRK